MTSKARLLSGSEAAAWGARLADARSILTFPEAPSTGVVERLSEWSGANLMQGELTAFESEHTMQREAGACAMVSQRAFCAAPRSALLQSLHQLRDLCAWRAPLVAVAISGAAEGGEAGALQRFGGLQLHCATCQEVLDAVLLGFRVAEDRRVRLPVLLTLDDADLARIREPVQLVEQDDLRLFLPRYLLAEARTPDPGRHAFEVPLAAARALEAFDDAARDFASLTGRHYEAVHAYRMDDAEFAFLMTGSAATQVMHTVDGLREQGVKVGLIRPRLLRPLPRAALRRYAGRVKGIAVIDQELTPGLGGPLCAELAGTIYDLPSRPVLVSYVGGPRVGAGELSRILHEVKEAVLDGQPPPPRLLLTEPAARRRRAARTIAAVEAARRARA